MMTDTDVYIYIGGSVPDVCILMAPLWLSWGFSLPLIVCELESFLLFHYSIIIDLIVSLR